MKYILFYFLWEKFILFQNRVTDVLYNQCLKNRLVIGLICCSFHLSNFFLFKATVVPYQIMSKLQKKSFQAYQIVYLVNFLKNFVRYFLLPFQVIFSVLGKYSYPHMFGDLRSTAKLAPRQNKLLCSITFAINKKKRLVIDNILYIRKQWIIWKLTVLFI